MKLNCFFLVIRHIAGSLELRRINWLVLAGLLMFGVSSSFGQSDDYPKFEFYGGYSQARFKTNVQSASFTDPGGTQTFSNLCSAATGQQIGVNSQKFFCEYRGFNGFDTSVTYNVSKYVGVKGNFSGHFKTDSFADTFTPPGVTQILANKERIYNLLGGVQIKNNSRDVRFKPFAHVLAGLNRYTNSQKQILDLFPQFNFTIQDNVNSFAMKLGGGIDVRVSKHVDVRLIEVDYNPAFTRDRTAKIVSGSFTNVVLNGRTAHTYTFGAGIVIH